MRQITISVNECHECPYYEPQPYEQAGEVGECLKLNEAVCGLATPPDSCPFPEQAI